MLPELMEAIVEAVTDKEIWVSDVLTKSIYVSYWHPEGKEYSGTILSKDAPYRRIAEQRGCEKVFFRWQGGLNKLVVVKNHAPILNEQELLNFIKSVCDDDVFILETSDKCYPGKDCLIFKVFSRWLKFPADFSMYSVPYSTTMGFLDISPKHQEQRNIDFYHVIWNHENNQYPDYDQLLEPSQIEVLEESDVVVELL